MKSKHAFLYYLTVLLIETALIILLAFVYALFTDPRPWDQYLASVPILRTAKSAVVLTGLRIVCGQIPVNILFHLLALGRARGYARVVWSSVLVNTGTFLLLCLVLVYLGASQSYGFVARSAQPTIQWVALAGTLGALLVPPALAPILALRSWRRAVI